MTDLSQMADPKHIAKVLRNALTQSQQGWEEARAASSDRERMSRYAHIIGTLEGVIRAVALELEK